MAPSNLLRWPNTIGWSPSPKRAFGQPCLGSYSAAKWAIRGITRQAALELAASGIRVNSVLPGFIDTMMGGQGGRQRESIRLNKGHAGATVPLGRIGEPE